MSPPRQETLLTESYFSLAAQGAPTAADEAARIGAVRRYDILDTPPDGAFDRVAFLAARFLDAPIATVSIVDHDRIWFKARHGLEATEIPRLPGLCASAILRDEPYVVNDAVLDPRTLDNPLVLGELGLRFYAAAPLVTNDGYRLGTLNVIDKRPRQISPGQVAILEDLAAIVVDELELRLAARRVLEAKAQLERLGEALQRNVVPPALPAIPGLDLAGYYQPGDKALEIGGDFYDVIEIRPGVWTVAIGDVSGRGVDAAVLMSSIRHRLRALAAGGRAPSEILAELNRSLLNDSLDERFCTLCCLQLERGPRHVRAKMSCAAHPLPLLRRSDGEIQPVGVHAPPLGLFPEITFHDVWLDLEPGDLLLLYTDGLVERRGLDIELGEEALRSAIREGGALEAASLLGLIERSMPTSVQGRDDDAAMLLLRVTS